MKNTAKTCVLLIGILVFTAPAYTQSEKSGNDQTTASELYQTIDWKSLTPEPDLEIYKKYRSGKLSQGALHSYMESFYNTPSSDLNDRKVQLTGYLLPQNLDKNGLSTEFLFVRKVTSWSHTDQILKPNQAVLVNYSKGMKFKHSTQARFQVSGVFNVGRYSVEDTDVFYQLEATTIKVKQRRFNEYD